MNFWKVSFLVLFSGCALVCVGYAHSATRQDARPEISVWKAPFLLGSCRLKIQQTAGSTVIFTLPGETRVAFEGYWPQVPGTVFTQHPARREMQKLPSLEPGVPAEPEKTLEVTFGEVNGRIVPTSYLYTDNKVYYNGIRLGPKSCASLSLEE